MEVRSDVLIDVSSSPFVSCAQQVRKALARLRVGEVLKVRTRSAGDGRGVYALAQEAQCDVLHCAARRHGYECLIRRPWKKAGKPGLERER